MAQQYLCQCQIVSPYTISSWTKPTNSDHITRGKRNLEILHVKITIVFNIKFLYILYYII